MKQQINNLTIHTLKNSSCYWIVNDTSSQQVLSEYGFDSICLNGYDIQPFIQMLEGSSKANRYCYLIATDTSPQGINNAYELRDYFRENWKEKKLYSMNYTLAVLKIKGYRDIEHMAKENKRESANMQQRLYE